MLGSIPFLMAASDMQMVLVLGATSKVNEQLQYAQQIVSARFTGSARRGPSSWSVSRQLTWPRFYVPWKTLVSLAVRELPGCHSHCCCVGLVISVFSHIRAMVHCAFSSRQLSRDNTCDLVSSPCLLHFEYCTPDGWEKFQGARNRYGPCTRSSWFSEHTAMRPFNLLSGGQLARAQVACLLAEARRCAHSLVPCLFPQERAQTWIDRQSMCQRSRFSKRTHCGCQTLSVSLRILSVFRGPGIDEWPIAVGHHCFDVARFHDHSPPAHTQDTCCAACAVIPLCTGAVYVSVSSSASSSNKRSMPQPDGHATIGSLSSVPLV